MKLVGIAIIVLSCICSDAFRLPAFFRWPHDAVPSEHTAKKGAVKNRFISPMLSRVSELTKGAPVEFTPIPVIVGTKAELVELKRVLEESEALPENTIVIDPNVPDDKIISVPVGMSDLIEQLPSNDIVLPPEEPRNVTCQTSVEDLLPLLRKHPIPSLVHDNPEMILSMIQALVPKPEFFKMEPEPELLPSSKKLISLAVRNPDWVRALISAEPTILNDMLGLSSTSETGSEGTIEGGA